MGFKLEFDRNNSEYGTAPVVVSGQADIIFELKNIMFTDIAGNAIVGSSTGVNNRLFIARQNVSGGVLWIGCGDSSDVTTIPISTNVLYSSLRLEYTFATKIVEYFINNVKVDEKTNVIFTDDVDIMGIGGYFAGGSYNVVNSQSNELGSVVLNDETWNFPEGPPSTTTTGSLGTVLTLNSTASTDDMWVFVPDEATATYRMCMAMAMGIPFMRGK